MTLAICLEDFLNWCSWLPPGCCALPHLSPCLHSHTWRLQFNKLSTAGTNLETFVHRRKPPSLPRAFGLGCQCKLNWHQVSRELSIKFLQTEGQRWCCSPLSCQFHKSIGKQINIQSLKYNFFSLLKGGSVNDYARTPSHFQRWDISPCFQLGTCLKVYHSQKASFHHCSFHQTNLKQEYKSNHCSHYQCLTSSCRTAWALYKL